MKLLSHAEQVLVLDAGKVQYQGSLDEITRQGYDISSKLLGDSKKSSQKAAEERGVEHVSEVEAEEPPIAEASRGWTPYLFFAHTSTWKNTVIAMVRVAFVVRCALFLAN